jgi:hypothetical protein
MREDRDIPRDPMDECGTRCVRINKGDGEAVGVRWDTGNVQGRMNVGSFTSILSSNESLVIYARTGNSEVCAYGAERFPIVFAYEGITHKKVF